MDNSIRLKELQVGSEALRKGDEGLGIFIFFFERVFLGEEVKTTQLYKLSAFAPISPPLSKGIF